MKKASHITHIIPLLLLLFSTPLLADGGGRIECMGLRISGETRYELTIPAGQSALEWPLEHYLVGLNATVDMDDHLEAELTCLISPWQISESPLKDSDWLVDTHPRLRYYSETDLDTRGLLLWAQVRFYPIAHESLSLGITGGYRFQEFSFMGYDALQAEYTSGDWSGYVVGGEVITYRVLYDLVQAGLSLRLRQGDAFHLTLDTSFIPLARVRDADNHLRRYKKLQGSCIGDGIAVDLAVRYRVYARWHLLLTGGLTRVSTSGHQDQIWYGDDPITPGTDDTGQASLHLPLKVELNAVHLGCGLGLQF